MTSLLPVKPDTISAEDKARLQTFGIIVVEHPTPSEVKLVTTDCEAELPGLLAKFLADLAKKVGPDYIVRAGVEIKGLIAGPGLGPPVNADRQPITFNPSKKPFIHKNNLTLPIWVFVQGAVSSVEIKFLPAATPSWTVINTAIVSSSIAVSISWLPSPAHAFVLQPQESIRVKYSLSAVPAISWCLK